VGERERAKEGEHIADEKNGNVNLYLCCPLHFNTSIEFGTLASEFK